MYSVAIYNATQMYGGPEEGGWWYDQLSLSSEDNLALHTKFFQNEDDAYAYSRYLNRTVCEEYNKLNEYEYTSVLAEPDAYITAQVHEGYPPTYDPDERPHYE